MLVVDHAPWCLEGRSEQHVLQLPHVAGPSIGDETGERVRAQRAIANLGRERPQKPRSEQRDVRSPFTKRGYRHEQHGEAVEEVLAEGAPRDTLVQRSRLKK